MLNEGEWLIPCPCHLIPGNGPVPIWAPGPVWMGAEISPPLGFDPRPFQPVVNHYTDCCYGP